MCPEAAKPPSVKGGSLVMSNCLAAFDTSDHNEPLVCRQALRIRQRFPVSTYVALVAARLVYGGAS